MQLEVNQLQALPDKRLVHKEYTGYLLVVLAICFLPFERYEIYSGIRAVDLILIPLVGYGLLTIWFHKNRRIELPLILPIGLILMASLIATRDGISYKNGIVVILQETYLFIWFVVLTNFLILFSVSGMDRLAKIWTVIALLESATTLMGMLRIGPDIFYTEPMSHYVLTSSGINRGIGTFVNPNAAAAYLSISFFILLTTSWPNLAKTMFSIWMFLGIFATGSMGAMLSMIGGFVLLILAFIFMRNPRAAILWIALLVIFISIAVLVVVIFGPLLLKPLEKVADVQWLVLTVGRFPTSMMSRVVLIQNGWAVYKFYPFGIGPNTSGLFNSELHNDYIAFLFERGPFGLIGWLWFIWVSLSTVWKTAQVQTSLVYRWQILALGAAFFSMIVNAFSHEIFHFRQVWMLMAFLFAYCSVLSILPHIASADLRWKMDE